MLETVCDLPKLTLSGDWVELIPAEGVVVFNPFTDHSLWVNTVSNGLELLDTLAPFIEVLHWISHTRHSAGC